MIIVIEQFPNIEFAFKQFSFFSTENCTLIFFFSCSHLFPDDCPNCVDENVGNLATSRWTMPLLKLGEKRYYLGIFFKVKYIPTRWIHFFLHLSFFLVLKYCHFLLLPFFLSFIYRGFIQNS